MVDQSYYLDQEEKAAVAAVACLGDSTPVTVVVQGVEARVALSRWTTDKPRDALCLAVFCPRQTGASKPDWNRYITYLEMVARGQNRPFVVLYDVDDDDFVDALAHRGFSNSANSWSQKVEQ